MAKINREEKEYDKRKANEKIDQHATSGTNVSDHLYYGVGHYSPDDGLVADQEIELGNDFPFQESQPFRDVIICRRGVSDREHITNTTPKLWGPAVTRAKNLLTLCLRCPLLPVWGLW